MENIQRETQLNPYYFEFKSVRQKIDENINLIKNNIIKNGDIVYCSKILEDVIFLEGPNIGEIKKYQENLHTAPVFPFLVKFKTLTGELGNCPIACIAKISLGNYFSEYEINKKRKDAEIILENLVYNSRSNGFRVETIDKKKSYVIKFYGNSQNEVDEFKKCIKLAIQ